MPETPEQIEILDALPDATVVADGEGRIILINPVAEKLFGYTNSECLGKPVEMLLPDHHRAGHITDRARYSADPVRRPLARGRDLTARHCDGHEIAVDVNLSPLHTHAGTRIIATVHDVSDRRRTENSLRESELRYRRLAENASDIVARRRLTEPQGTDYISSASEQILGYRPDEFYSDPDLLLKIIDPRDADLVGGFRDSPESFPPTFTARAIAKDGSLKWIECHISLVRDESGTLVAIDAIVRDVTEAKVAGDALADSEGRLRAAIENLPFFVWAYDRDGRCFLQNVACKAQWGDRVGQLLKDMPFEAPVLASWRETFDRTIKGDVVHREDEFESDPEHRLFHSTAAPILSGDSIGGVLIVNIDVTEQRRSHALELELRASHESERLKDSLLSTVSHELRTPISVIRGYATLAVDYGDKLTTLEVRQYLRDIDKHAVELERLVNDLLTLSRLEAGVLAMEPQPVDIASLVNDVLSSLEVVHGSRQVRVSVDPPVIQAVADPDRLGQVLYNLLDNAGKYSDPDAHIEVSVTGAEDRVALAVRDYGPGVSHTELDAIFGRFYQAPDRPRVTGAGLGLAICRSIVEAHGGTIEAALPDGGGLQVTVSLPAVPAVS